jgi:hypothetical protein
VRFATTALTSAILLVSASSAAAQCDRRHDSVLLAVQWFDPTHAWALNEDSWLSEQMHRTLVAVDSALPQLASVCMYDYFRQDYLITEVDSDSLGVVLPPYRAIAALVDSVQVLCYGQQPTFGSARGGADVTEGPTDSETNTPRAERTTCGAVPLLPSALPEQMTLTTSYAKNAEYYQIRLGWRGYTVDWVELQRRLSALPTPMGRLAARLSAQDANDIAWVPAVIPQYQLVAVGDGSAHHTDDPIVLRYGIGWGDCPMGCTAYHSWTVSVAQQKHDDVMMPAGIRILDEDGAAYPPRPRK